MQVWPPLGTSGRLCRPHLRPVPPEQGGSWGARQFPLITAEGGSGGIGSHGSPAHAVGRGTCWQSGSPHGRKLLVCPATVSDNGTWTGHYTLQAGILWGRDQPQVTRRGQAALRDLVPVDKASLILKYRKAPQGSWGPPRAPGHPVRVGSCQPEVAAQKRHLPRNRTGTACTRHVESSQTLPWSAP